MSEKANWLIGEDVALFETWVLISHDPVTGNERRVQHVEEDSFTRHECWNNVKHIPKYKVLPTGLEVVLNDTPLHESTTEESPLKPQLNRSHRPKRSRGKKAAKKRATRGRRSNNDYSKLVDKLARQHALTIEQESLSYEQE